MCECECLFCLCVSMWHCDDVSSGPACHPAFALWLTAERLQHPSLFWLLHFKFHVFIGVTLQLFGSCEIFFAILTWSILNNSNKKKSLWIFPDYCFRLINTLLKQLNQHCCSCFLEALVNDRAQALASQGQFEINSNCTKHFWANFFF